VVPAARGRPAAIAQPAVRSRTVAATLRVAAVVARVRRAAAEARAAVRVVRVVAGAVS
jgi:hypothetical protein